MRSTNFKATLVVFLALAIASHATTCGEGSDGSVANCCDAVGGTCTFCDVNYGLSKDKTQCVKCKDPKCAYCPGNPSVCKGVVQPEIPNCANYPDDNSYCYECYDGYSLNPMEIGPVCITCSVANCSECSKPNVCRKCYVGNALVKNKCIKCKDPNCWICAPNLTTCKECNAGYGINGGKCTKCGVNVESCDGGKIKCVNGAGTFGSKGICRYCADKCSVCNKSACDKCYVGYSLQNGKCIANSG